MALYAIKIGKECNKVVETWAECKALIDGVPFAKYRKVNSMEDAEDFLYGASDQAETGDYRDIDVCYLFSDGSCSKNPGPGGWGTVVRFNGQEKNFSGGNPDTTNNQMELTGVIRGLEYIIQTYGKNKKVVVYSDSSYVINGASEWMHTWEENGWVRKGGSIANLEEWQKLFNLTKKIKNIEFHWIRGHAGHKYNEICDSLAVAETKKQMRVVNAVKPEKEKTDILTNYDLIVNLTKEELLFLFASTKFKNYILMQDAMKINEMLNAPASDWGVDVLKKKIKGGDE